MEDALDTLDPWKFEPHAAGILAILPIPNITTATFGKFPRGRRHILITGGYDDYVRVYGVGGIDQLGAKTRPAALAELHIGHGVYKLKFIGERCSYRRSTELRYTVLASCTNAGVRILHFIRKENGSIDGEWSIVVMASVTQHRSLCYASDTMPLSPSADVGRNEIFDNANSESIYPSTVVVSTSMYDKLLCVWRYREQDFIEKVDGISKTRSQDDLVLSEVNELS